MCRDVTIKQDSYEVSRTRVKRDAAGKESRDQCRGAQSHVSHHIYPAVTDIKAPVHPLQS